MTHNSENLQHTRPINEEVVNAKRIQDEITKQSIREIYIALCEKGYDPVAQLTGYILSGDPTYITTHKNARIMASRIDGHDMMRIIIEDFFKEKKETTSSNKEKRRRGIRRTGGKVKTRGKAKTNRKTKVKAEGKAKGKIKTRGKAKAWKSGARNQGTTSTVFIE